MYTLVFYSLVLVVLVRVEKMNAELVFIPSPGAGHLTSAIQLAKHLLDCDNRISITLLLMKSPNSSTTSHFTPLLTHSDRMRFIHLPPYQPKPESVSKKFMTALIENQIPHVKQYVTDLIFNNPSPNPPRLAGFVVDMFCTQMIDVANEFGVPSYIFFTSSAAFLSLELHVQFLHDHQNQDVTELKDELIIPSFRNPLPAKILPSVMLSKQWIEFIFESVRRFKETKGIMVNTFTELEHHAINSLSEGMNPPVYPVGPLLNLESNETSDSITKWLDDQPPSSVVYLCFGSMGSFPADQVKEIAMALEQSGYRFLWSLRKPPPKDTFNSPTEYTNLEDVLPEGFLDRTSGIGKVISWAPQVTVLAHPATGGFVSHCGWNSTLESLWNGVPIATWPLYAEQQFNAFTLVVELGLAVEIKMDYRNDFIFPNTELVKAEEIEKGIRCLMDPDSETRKKVKIMSENSKKALMDGGSSPNVLRRYIQDVLDNMP